MTLRVSELETLFTADVSQIEQAEKKLKAAKERAQKNPVKIGVDDKDALAGMDRVEKAAKKLVSRDTALKLDADITRAEKSLARTQQRLEDLKVRALGGLDVTADTKRAEAQLQRTQRTLDALVNARGQIEVEADPAPALAAMDRVEAAAKRIVSQETALRINANYSAAEKAVKDLQAELDYLKALAPTVEVTADIAKAEAKLDGARAALRDLDGARAEMQVDVNEGGAKQKLTDVADFAGDAGEEGGKEAGQGLSEGIISALVSIPIAGAVVGIGVAAGRELLGAIQDGLGKEAGVDRLAGLTGIDESSAMRLARAAGEAYANVFGESIEANMDTARLALQFDIIDEDASTRQAQRVVQSLAGIADVLQEDIQPVASTVATMLRTGIAKSADEAFDILATGARVGANRAEDLLDTFTEYPALFARLGITGPEALGLINQGLDAGARNSDLVADALKELQIRSTDASETSAEGYRLIGLNAEEMTAKMAAGGESARTGLDQILDGLRGIEDPVARNAAGVALIGTQWEDLGDAILALDLTTAAEQLDGVTGSAQKMFDTLSNNDATRIEQAKRNIEVAADGIKGALAAALSEPLGDFASWVSENRGPLTQFLLDMANGALSFGEALVIAAADGTEAFGDFVAGPLADVVDGIGTAIDAVNGIFAGRPAELDELRDSMRGFDDTAADAADTMRENLLPRISEARDRLNEWGEPIVQLGYLNDAALRTADAVSQVGVNAEDGAILLDGFTRAQDGSVQASTALEEQLRNALAAMSEEIDTAVRAGETQEDLQSRYTATRDALIAQMEQMGLTREEAQALIDTVLQTPPEATTSFDSNATEQQEKVQALADRIDTLPDGEITIKANTEPARLTILELINEANRQSATVGVGTVLKPGATPPPQTLFPTLPQASGGVLEFMALGGLTPMAPVAQMVPPQTWRVVGDRGDVTELFAPLDGSARSWNLLLEGLRRMPGSPPVAPMADGGMLTSATAASAGPAGAVFQFGDISVGTNLTVAEILALIERGIRDELNRQFSTRGGLA